MKTMILLDKDKYDEVKCHLNDLYEVSHDIGQLTDHEKVKEMGMRIRRVHDRINDILKDEKWTKDN